jgi:hypothetical protein
MPVVHETKRSVASGSSLDELILGETLAAKIYVVTTRAIEFSYDVVDGISSSDEGSFGGNCYSITRTRHTLRWKAHIKTRRVTYTATALRRFAKWVVSGVEDAGAAGTAAGGVVVLYGAATSELGVGAPVAVLGAGFAAVSGIFWGLGSLLNKAVSGWDVEVHESEEDKHDSLDYESVSVAQIECLPNRTYPALPAVPRAKTAGEAENEAVKAVLASL